MPKSQPTAAAASPPYIYLPSGWDKGWKAAKLAAPSSPVVVTSIGDSIPAGVNLTDYKQTYFNQLITALQAKYGKYGDFWTTAENSTMASAANSPWTGWAGGEVFSSVYSYGVGFTSTGYTSATAASAQKTFTLPYAASSLEIVWNDVWPGSWAWNKNGGAQSAITNNSAAASAANYTLRKAAVGGAWAAADVLGIGWQSATATAFLQGVNTYTGTANGIFGARMNCTRDTAGNRLLDSGNTFNYPASRSSLLSGFAAQNNTPGRPASFGAGFGYPHGAQLVIAELLVNSLYFASGPATVYQGYQRMIHAMRAYGSTSFVFVMPAVPHWIYTDVNVGLNWAQQNYMDQWNQYKDAVHTVARENCCAVIDIDTKWCADGTPFADGYMANNDIHPLAAGHTDIYNQLLSIL